MSATPPLTFAQTEQLWETAAQNVGVPAATAQETAPYAAAIAMEESGGNPSPSTGNGGGLWQIEPGSWNVTNVPYSAAAAANPLLNAEAAVNLWENSGAGPDYSAGGGFYNSWLQWERQQGGTGVAEQIFTTNTGASPSEGSALDTIANFFNPSADGLAVASSGEGGSGAPAAANAGATDPISGWINSITTWLSTEVALFTIGAFALALIAGGFVWLAASNPTVQKDAKTATEASLVA